jgi:enamine deaminase RidA (YjgF/YER057c/UK114 family)
MREALQPAGLHDARQFAYSHVIATGPGKLIFVAGQVAWDANGQLVGGSDVIAQARQALANVRTALGAAGASPADIVTLRSYVVGYKPEYVEGLLPELQRFFGDANPPACTLLGVQALALPDLLIEIEVQAVVD